MLFGEAADSGVIMAADHEPSQWNRSVPRGKDHSPAWAMESSASLYSSSTSMIWDASSTT